MKTFILIFAGITLAAQQTVTAPTPIITLAEQADWLQARAELAEAQIAVVHATEKLTKLSRTLNERCPVVLDKEGRPTCKAVGAK